MIGALSVSHYEWERLIRQSLTSGIRSDYLIMILTDEFPLTRNRIWFDTATTGACPASTLAVMEECMADIMSRLRGEGGSVMPSEKWAERRLNSINPPKKHG